MKFLVLSILMLGSVAHASLIDETRTNDVNSSSTHIDCKLSDLDPQFASYSRIVIETSVGDDSPKAVVFDADGTMAEEDHLSDITEHPERGMRIFNLYNYETQTAASLVVFYTKKASGIQASAILTSNGQSTIRNAEMTCEYLGKMAIN